MAWLSVRKKEKSKEFEDLAKKLEQKKSLLLEEFKDKHKDVTVWAKRKGVRLEDLASKGARGVAAGFATGMVVLSSGVMPGVGETAPKSIKRDLSDASLSASVTAKKEINEEVRQALQGVNLSDEKAVSKKLSKVLKIKVTPELDGIRLNTNHGVIGYESHLARYPGDNLAIHFQTNSDYQRFARGGWAGGSGAWGYIAPSREALNDKDIEREKYYLVAQTWLSPNWGSPQVKQWFRHRKMIVVNPQNGAVVVGVLEDAGPEPWTGRSFGGSPEAMEELGLGHGGTGVFMFFVEDPKDKIPLGGYAL